MTVLTNFYLEDATNQKILRAVQSIGGTFLVSPVEREERIAHVDAHIEEAEILYGGWITDEQWARAHRLRWIQVPWAGVNTLLATIGSDRRGVAITSSSGIMADSVADHTMATIVMLARDLANQIRAQDRHEWKRYETESPKRQILRGKTLGILGFGAIGRSLAIRARAFGMRVIAMKRTVDSVPAELDAVFTPTDLHSILAESDIVVVALPLTDATRGLIGRDELASMKPGAHFVNIARGGVVDESALIDALQSRSIAGAALDVFEREPLASDSPLWSMENVIVTPHSSGAFMGFGDASASLFIDNLGRWTRGEELHNVVRDGY